MAWVPLAASGIGFTANLPDGVTMNGSVVTGVRSTAPELQAWEIALAKPVKVRVTIQEFDSSGYAESGAFVFGYPSGLFESIDNAGGANEWSPNPVASGGDVVNVMYGPGDQSDYPNDSYTMLVEVQAPSYNCECDDDYPRTTLAQMRNRLATRLGFATQVAMGVLPPGMAPLLDDFIRNAQEMLYRRYSVFRMERFYVWDMQPGVRFYDFDANTDACPKHMDPRMVTWVGISQGDLSWRPLGCGIDPVMYGSPGSGIPSHYEIRQCIEVWPAPVDDTWKLRIKGHFGLLPLAADSDETTIDPEAIFLQALANAKAHYGQPDAGNYASQATAYVHSLVAGSHHTRRYVPGVSRTAMPWVRPVPVGGWPEDSP